VVKLDARTGALLAKPANGEGGAYEPVLPIGFYTGFGDYLATNLSLIDEAKAQGFTVIHPIPGDPDYGNTTQLQAVIQRMQEVGMYLMYDMRWSYMNDTLVAEQVEMVKNSPALLLWYTGDEPDGSSDPLNATSHAYDLIYDLDGYHPVSLCLNCYDYYWSDYAAGADIILQDAYMISINATWSIEWISATVDVMIAMVISKTSAIVWIRSPTGCGSMVGTGPKLYGLLLRLSAVASTGRAFLRGRSSLSKVSSRSTTAEWES